MSDFQHWYTIDIMFSQYFLARSVSRTKAQLTGKMTFQFAVAIRYNSATFDSSFLL